MRTVLLLLFAAISATCGVVCSASLCDFKESVVAADFQFSKALGTSMTLHWKLVQNEDATKFTHVCFGLVGSSTIKGWVGFGISENELGNMVPSGVVVMTASANGYEVKARKAAAYDRAMVMPTTDFSIFEESGTVIDGIFNMQFARLIDGTEQFPIVSNGTSKVVYANFHAFPGVDLTTNQLAEYHDEKGRLEINFLTGASLKTTDSLAVLKYIHGALMFAAWGVAAPFMSVLARYKWRDWWFPIHKYVQLFVVLLTLTSFGMIVYTTQKGGQTHFANLHPIFGLCVVCATFLNPLLGFWADKVFDEKRHSVPLLPDRLHGFLGWLLYVSAQAALILGLLYITGNDWKNGWVVAACVVIGAVFLICAIPIVREAMTLLLGHNVRHDRHVQDPHESHKLLDSNVERVAEQAFRQM